MTIPRKTTCFDCIYSDKIAGNSGSYWEPPDAAEANCFLPDSEVTFEQAEAAYEDASDCPRFSPVLSGKCVCGKNINTPLHLHQIFSFDYYSGEPIPMCSDDCQKKMDAKNAEIKAFDLEI